MGFSRSRSVLQTSNSNRLDRFACTRAAITRFLAGRADVFTLNSMQNQGKKFPRCERILDEYYILARVHFQADWTRKKTIANWTAPRGPFCLSSLSPRCLNIYLFSLFTRIYKIRQLTSRTLLCSGRYSYSVYSVRHRSLCLQKLAREEYRGAKCTRDHHASPFSPRGELR